jgi:NADH-quinone oxidoreductase subunit A
MDDAEKLSSYEAGFNPFGSARMKISILYWVIGILYLIFDLE